MRLYNLTRTQILEAIESTGYTVASVRGGTIKVANASGKRQLGEVFECRDGGWDHRLEGLAVRVWETLATVGSCEPVAAQSEVAVVAAINAGHAASAGVTEQQVLDAVRARRVSVSAAMNQDD